MTGRDGGRDIDLRAHARDGMRLDGLMTDHRDGVRHFERVTNGPFVPPRLRSTRHCAGVGDAVEHVLTGPSRRGASVAARELPGQRGW